MTFRAQGMRAWLLQRFSAAYLALFVLAAVLWLATGGSADYSGWRALLGRPVVSVAFALFFLSLFFHAWVGIRDVLMDYVPNLKLRLLLLVAVALLLMGLAVWSALILISVYLP